MQSPFSVAHSRWNELDEQALLSAGYTILTRSDAAGVDLFVKMRKRLFLFFQGHPEYQSKTLLREYRRDVGRFIDGSSTAYPAMPDCYFDATAAAALSEFQAQTIADPRQERLAAFPFMAAENGLTDAWCLAAAGIFRNWLRYVAAEKARAAGAAQENGAS
jgi:homoserine O-succinyltransferase